MPARLFALDVNAYVVDCDVDAHYGQGCVRFGTLAEAKVFPDTRAALEYWKRQSHTVPLRPDGKPNRPLTAYSVSVERS
jgi:hypothetical protein